MECNEVWRTSGVISTDFLIAHFPTRIYTQHTTLSYFDTIWIINTQDKTTQIAEKLHFFFTNLQSWPGQCKKEMQVN